jgi:hypothetical protein
MPVTDKETSRKVPAWQAELPHGFEDNATVTVNLPYACRNHKESEGVWRNATALGSHSRMQCWVPKKEKESRERGLQTHWHKAHIHAARAWAWIRNKTHQNGWWGTCAER